MFEKKKILVLAPHTDDGELGCGGTIARFCAAGKEVFYAAFSLCAKSLPDHLPAHTLADECKKATALLSIPGNNLLLFDYPVREFSSVRQQILEDLVRINKTIAPDLVLLPAAGDLHQDHQVIYQEGLRAFKHCSVAGYELPWNNSSFQPEWFCMLGEADLLRKTDALKAYHSQAHRNYMQQDFIRSLAIVRGVQCNSRFAEAFEVYRIIS